MQDVTISEAIEAALRCDWQKAVSVNQKLLKVSPDDIDCLNRLGKAFLEIGENKKAATFFRKVLRIDKYNPIAQKNLEKTSSPSKTKTKTTTLIQARNFLEEPGKTRLVSLVNIASASVLSKQDHTDCLNLFPKRHTVVVQDSEGNYVGALPDDLGHRLSILMKGGNRYEAITKSVTKNSIVIFLREVYRSKKFHNTPSFLSSNSPDYLSFLREESAPTDELKSSLTDDVDESNDGQDEPRPVAKFSHADDE